ncbi:hypothetical protein QF032_005131 [Streptomyces achromogenes]|nr:hypothetical protein [Streptomyces achromogenes]
MCGGGRVACAGADGKAVGGADGVTDRTTRADLHASPRGG